MVASHILSAEAPSFATIVELDRKVQEYSLITTGPLASAATAALDVSLTMRRMAMLQSKEAREIISFVEEIVSRQLTFDTKCYYTFTEASSPKLSWTTLQTRSRAPIRGRFWPCIVLPRIFCNFSKKRTPIGPSLAPVIG